MYNNSDFTQRQHDLLSQQVVDGGMSTVNIRNVGRYMNLPQPATPTCFNVHMYICFRRFRWIIDISQNRHTNQWFSFYVDFVSYIDNRHKPFETVDLAVLGKSKPRLVSWGQITIGKYL